MGTDPLHCLLDGYPVQLGTVPETEAHSPRIAVLSTSYEDEWRFRPGCVSDLLAETIVREVKLDSNSVGPQPGCDIREMIVELVGHGDAEHLHRGEPGWEGPGVVFGQHPEEPFN